MPDLDFSIGIYGRPSAGLPSVIEANAYSEPTQGGPKQAARIGRPGLTRWGTLGAGPVLRQFHNPGLFNGALFSVSGDAFYSGTTNLQIVPYTNTPRMAAINGQLAIVVGGSLYVYDGTTVTLVRYFSDGSSPLPAFSGVAVLYEIFVFPVEGTNQFYYSAAGDAKSIDAANLSAAQTTPDPIVEVETLGEELYFFKSLSTEIWDFNPIVNAAGQVTAPFQESQGRSYIRGCQAQGSVAKLDNALFWVGDDLAVYRTSNVPVKISTPYIDDRLRAGAASSTETLSFPVGIEGHWFYVANLPKLGETYAYDCATQQWAQWGTQETLHSGLGPYLGACAAGNGPQIWVGSLTDGRVWLADSSNNTDDGSARAVIVTAAIWVTGATQRLNNVSLACVRGVGTSSAPEPRVRARFSYDGGRTFTSWMDGALGPAGGYRYKAIWRGLGLIQQPGVLIQFWVLDPVQVTIEGGSYNEARP